MSSTTVPIFVTGVSFPTKKPGDIDRAWLELEDDADSHPLKIAVPVAFARELARHFPTDEGESPVAQVTIVFGDDGAKKLPALLETPPPAPTSPLDVDARAQQLVNLRRAYEAKLPDTEEETVEHEHQRGIVTGIQLAINVLKGQGVPIDDPAPPKARRAKAKVPAAGGSAPKGDGELGRTAKAVLRVAAMRAPHPSSRLQLAVLSGYSFTSGGYDQALRDLVDEGLLVRTGPGPEYTTTAEGIARAGTVGHLPRGNALLKLWTDKLETQAGNVLEAIVSMARRDERPSRLGIAECTGYSESSGGFDGALRHLRKLGLIEKGTNQPVEELLR